MSFKTCLDIFQSPNNYLFGLMFQILFSMFDSIEYAFNCDQFSLNATSTVFLRDAPNIEIVIIIYEIFLFYEKILDLLKALTSNK